MATEETTDDIFCIVTEDVDEIDTAETDEIELEIRLLAADTCC